MGSLPGEQPCRVAATSGPHISAQCTLPRAAEDESGDKHVNHGSVIGSSIR
jgi:hypothetical protein